MTWPPPLSFNVAILACSVVCPLKSRWCCHCSTLSCCLLDCSHLALLLSGSCCYLEKRHDRMVIGINSRLRCLVYYTVISCVLSCSCCFCGPEPRLAWGLGGVLLYLPGSESVCCTFVCVCSVCTFNILCNNLANILAWNRNDTQKPGCNVWSMILEHNVIMTIAMVWGYKNWSILVGKSQVNQTIFLDNCIWKSIKQNNYEPPLEVHYLQL